VNNKQNTKPNILFLVVDSFRADKAYGNERSCLTPNLDKLIENGTYFEQAISPSDATVLSLRSIFTGLLPFKTGLIKNKRINEKIDENIPTIIKILKKSGYHIIGKVPALAFLDSLYSEFANDEKFSVEKQWPRLEDGIGIEIIKKLKTNLEKPWFYYIHILDVHSKVRPGMPPLVIPEKYDDEKFGNSKYERAISAADYWLGKILEEINLEETTVILTADHGSFIPFYQNGVKISFEEISEPSLSNIKTPKFLNSLKRKVYSKIVSNKQKDIMEKINRVSLTEYEKRNLLCTQDKNPFRILFDEIVRVPLLFVGKDIPQGKIIKEQVSTRDILSTLIEFLHIEENIKTDGFSLCPILEGKNIKEEPIFIQSSFPMDKDFGHIVGIRTSKYKYNRSIDDPKENIFLYNLKEDPKEEKNIANEQPLIVNEYEKILKNCLTCSENKQEEVKESGTKNIEDELKKLGYI
jgi:arylsulfatase A-like enzyme